MVPEMRHPAMRVFWGAVLMLVVAGAARGQEARDDASRELRSSARTVDEPEQGTGFVGRLRSGLVGGLRSGLGELFTGERLQLHVNGAYQGSSGRSELETTFRGYGEEVRLLTREEFPGGAHVDAGGSLRVWRRLLLGASFTQLSRSGSGVVTGTVPHPLDMQNDRTLPEHDVALVRQERATHGYVGWRFPVRELLEVEFSAGATYYSLRRGIVAHLTPVETSGPPFAEVAVQVDVGEHTRNGVGFNAGIDVTYMLTPATRIPQLGIGFFTRMTGGGVSIPFTDSETRRRVSVGGLQAGIGLRARF